MSEKALLIHKVLHNKIVFLERSLSSRGEILVSKGDLVESFSQVGREWISRRRQSVNLREILGLWGNKLEPYLQVKVGDTFAAGEVLFCCQRLCGLIRRQFKAEFSGSVTGFDPQTGVLKLASTREQTHILAGLGGEVYDIIPERAVLIKSIASLIPGIWASGADVAGELVVLTKRGQILSADLLRPNLAGKLVVSGSSVTGEALCRAQALEIGGIVAGSVLSRDLESAQIPIMVTEGFGQIPISSVIWDFIKKVEARHCYLSPSGRYLAVPELGKDSRAAASSVSPPSEEVDLKEGMLVKVFSWPYFGLEGKVVSISREPCPLKSGLNSKVVVVDIPQKGEVSLPILNIGVLAG